MDNSKCQKLCKDRGICVIVPTYNNAGTIEKVLAEVLEYCQDVIVVDDGSESPVDASIFQDKNSNLIVVRHKKNRGKGVALQTGFRKALELDFAYAITIDADGQHYPSDIPVFVKANIDNPGTLIVGSRFESKDNTVETKLSKGSAFANKFSNFWFSVQTFHHLNDTQTGYRLYPLYKLYGLSLITSRYEAELELLVFSSWHGVKIVSVPIDVYYPPKEQRVSHFRPIKDFLRISLLNTVLCLAAIIYALPILIIRFLLMVVRTYGTLFLVTFLSWFLYIPIVAFWSAKKRTKEEMSAKVHNLIYNAARGAMLKIGIPGTRFSYSNQYNDDFNKPAVIICNHQSHFDLFCQMIFTPKIIFLTNNWVWNNPIYGYLIRRAEYYPVRDGIDAIIPHLHSLVERGYSIAVYPEGTRSDNCQIGRFHKGAFYIAQKLNIDILPMYLYGTGRVLKKKTYLLHKGNIYIEVGKRTDADTVSAQDSLQLKKCFHKHYVDHYAEICNLKDRDA